MLCLPCASRLFLAAEYTYEKNVVHATGDVVLRGTPIVRVRDGWSALASQGSLTALADIECDGSLRLAGRLGVDFAGIHLVARGEVFVDAADGLLKMGHVVARKTKSGVRDFRILSCTALFWAILYDPHFLTSCSLFFSNFYTMNKKALSLGYRLSSSFSSFILLCFHAKRMLSPS